MSGHYSLDKRVVHLLAGVGVIGAAVAVGMLLGGHTKPAAQVSAPAPRVTITVAASPTATLSATPSTLGPGRPAQGGRQ